MAKSLEAHRAPSCSAEPTLYGNDHIVYYCGVDDTLSFTPQLFLSGARIVHRPGTRIMNDPANNLEHAEILGTGLAVPAAIEEVTPELPVDIQADFSPVTQHQESERKSNRTIEPSHFDSFQAQEAFDSAVKAADDGQEDLAVEYYLKASKLAESAREWYIAAVACQRVGDFLKTPKPPFDLERSFRMYRRAVAAYQNCGLFAEARELSYRIMSIKMRRGSELRLPWWQQVELVAFWAIAGFGHRPLRVVGCAITFVLFYAAIYWSIGGIVSTIPVEGITFQQAVYFSGTTFSTVGYGDLVPAPHAQMIALTEAALGSFTMGLFVAVLAHRLNT